MALYFEVPLNVPENKRVIQKFQSKKHRPCKSFDYYQGIITSVQNPYRIYLQILDGDDSRRLTFLNSELNLEFSHISPSNLRISAVRQPQKGTRGKFFSSAHGSIIMFFES